MEGNLDHIFQQIHVLPEIETLKHHGPGTVTPDLIPVIRIFFC
jgi:hypothetical protein